MSECDYEDYVDWIWISCNYVPFMTLTSKNSCEYGDGGWEPLSPLKRLCVAALQKLTPYY